MTQLKYHFTYHPYLRSFVRPLMTSHGLWPVREGILICLVDSAGQQFWGEIAPMPWFGSETLAEAEVFCRSLAGQWHYSQKIPDHLPACQFAWSAALGYGQGQAPQQPVVNDVNWSVLLPAGDQALHSWQSPWQQGSRTFKWKIGVEPIDHELQILQQLIAALPAAAKLRLDANGGLTLPQAVLWLEHCDTLANIEFLEQPLTDLGAMQKLADRFQTPLALDESVSNLIRLQECYDRGWRGIFVVKPAISGSLDRLAEVIHQRQLDVVCSTCLESSVGQRAIMAWSKEQGFDRRAMGFGVQQWFAEESLAI